MKNVYLILACMLCFVDLSLAQSTTVRTFNYNSNTRDTMISFPEADHNSYSKILMHYSMRCKDGLVSTTAERNRGCGEWDYSCNTYIVDSTRVDSLKATALDYVFEGYSGDVFEYSNTPTFNFVRSTQREVIYNDAFFETMYPQAQGDAVADYQFGAAGTGLKIQYVVTADYLESEGLDRITGIRVAIENGTVDFENLTVRIAETNVDNLASLNLNTLQWEEFHYYNATLSSDDPIIKFYQDYKWDESSNLVINISYDNATPQNLELASQDFTEAKALVNQNANERFVSLNTTGRFEINEAIPEINEAITIAYWSKGAANLPANTTLLEGRDNDNRRQVNIHHPWGNGQIYWDCGNDGGGYDRINKVMTPDEINGSWHHWAFTKDITTGVMAIYLDGELWHSGTGMVKPIDIQAMNIGSSITGAIRSHFGDVDELYIFNEAFDESQVTTLIEGQDSPNYSNLPQAVIHYDFNGDIASTENLANPGQYDPELIGLLGQSSVSMRSQFVNTRASQYLFNHDLVSGTYIKDENEIVIIDSFPSLPQKVDHFSVQGTDLVEEWTEFYYPAGDYPVFDLDGNVIDNVNYPSDGSFTSSELLYYRKSPMAFEIMSFVTPYGIGIDFGLEGRTWTFDVTDFGPILKGDKRIFMSRGGQWQEEMDIRFEFIDGVPTRDVIDIEQIWPVNQVSYGQILDDWRYEPRTIVHDPNVHSYIIKTAVTGHGQEGEFIPRNHSVDLDGFTDSWRVWKECAENPVYPQGGTWVYDRAGWCPGMSTDVREFNISTYMPILQEAVVDYTVEPASGDSRYIVSSQLVKYGAPNKTDDIEISDIINPTANVEHARYNPNCHEPEIIIKNNGTNTINTVNIEYGIEGKVTSTYEWTGVLNYLSERRITLPLNIDFRIAEPGDKFFVNLTSSDINDQYMDNNGLVTDIVTIPDNYIEDVVIEYRTNNLPFSTSYRVEDQNGNVIHERQGTSLSANTSYRDTLSNLAGCYKIFITDDGQNGLSWWAAPNDGNGYVRVKSLNGSWKDIATDFGAFVEYNFSAGMISSAQELLESKSVKLYPNPSSQTFNILGLEDWNNQINIVITDNAGKLVYQSMHSKNELSNRELSFLEKYDEGMYIIRLNDDERFAVQSLIKL